MIKINLDEAYVFDLLSIYSVKLDKSNTTSHEQLLKNYNLLSEDIIKSIGIEKFNTIINSDEYEKLKNINNYVFELVDRANESTLSKMTADANFERYLMKKSIQDKFFDTSLSEIKI